MSPTTVYLIVGIGALAVTTGLIFLMRGKPEARRLTPLAGLAFGFILASILFGENRVLGYGLMGIGVVLAVIDILLKRRHWA